MCHVITPCLKEVQPHRVVMKLKLSNHSEVQHLPTAPSLLQTQLHANLLQGKGCMLPSPMEMKTYLLERKCDTRTLQ